MMSSVYYGRRSRTDPVVRCAIRILEREDLQVYLCSTVSTLLVVALS